MVKASPGGVPEIELGPSFEHNLSRRALSMLSDFVLVPLTELAYPRIEGLHILLAEWDDLDSDEDYAAWLRLWVGKPLLTRRLEDGRLERGEETTGDVAVPSEVIDVLTRKILDRDGDDRIVGIEGLRELLAAWEPYFDDDEKLLGHLLRAHDVDPAVVSWPHEQLLLQHASLHRESNIQR